MKMSYTVFNEKYKQALDRCLVLNNRLLFVGSTGVQLTLAAEIPQEEARRIISPTGHLEIYEIEDILPSSIEGIQVSKTSSPGLGPLLEREKKVYQVLGSSYPVAAPEHLVGMKLSTGAVADKDRWECYALLAVLTNKGTEVNYEIIRSFVKHCSDPGLELLIKEWSYTLQA